jgi:hypothetical protein
MKTKKTNQKPVEFDVHLKYECEECGVNHWLSFNEAKTKHYKVVCDCGSVFEIDRVLRFKLKYASEQQATAQISEQTEPKEKAKIPVDLLCRSATILVSQFGFTQSEAEDSLISTYELTPVDDCALLVKHTLENMRNM